MTDDPEVERRLQQLEAASAEHRRRIDEALRLVSELAVAEAEAQAPAAPAAPAPTAEHHPERRWYDDIPVKWISIWACVVLTLVLATSGWIKTELLEPIWKLLAGTVVQ